MDLFFFVLLQPMHGLALRKYLLKIHPCHVTGRPITDWATHGCFLFLDHDFNDILNLVQYLLLSITTVPTHNSHAGIVIPDMNQ